MTQNIDPGTALPMEEDTTMTGTTGRESLKRQHDESLVELAICKSHEKTAEKRAKIELDKSIKASPFKALYFPVPLEIRRLILKNILEPGEVHVRPQPDVDRVARQRVLFYLFDNQTKCPISANHFVSEKQPGPSSLPGFQILASCKQAYQEGVHNFYSKNTFYLPPGAVEHSIYHFDCLTPQNRQKIKKIAVWFGVEDLVPITTPQPEEVLGCKDQWSTAWETGKAGEDRLGEYFEEKLVEIWIQKLSWIPMWKTARIVKLKYSPLGKAFHIRGEQLDYYLEDVHVDPYAGLKYRARIRAEREYAGTVRAVTLEAAKMARKMIEDKIDTEGWKKCREWILAQQKI